MIRPSLETRSSAAGRRLLLAALAPCLALSACGSQLSWLFEPSATTLGGGDAKVCFRVPDMGPLCEMGCETPSSKSGYHGKHPGRSGELSAVEMKMARIAWKYFENNYQPTTGLVNSVDGFPSTTMWDTASYLGGLLAARELCIIDKHEFDKRLSKLLGTFSTLDLFQGELPNKAYNTETAAKVDYTNAPGEIGFSALDLGRLLIWFRILKERFPEHANGIDRALLRWNYCRVLDACGTMYGALKTGDKVEYLQEGRLGYEEYAAKGFQMWGFSTVLSSLAEPYETIPIFGVDVPYDTRDPRVLGAHNYVVAESYVLDAIELNWDEGTDRSSSDSTHTVPWMRDFADRIYLAQEGRYLETGVITARTEHQLAGPPYFVYDTIYTDGYPWNTITETGQFVPEHSAIALKGALGMWAVWETPYTDLLFDTISSLYDPEKGFYEGRYEISGKVIETFTANNNGIMLESLLYKTQGKLLRWKGIPGIWETALSNPFDGARRCLPQHPRECGAPRPGSG